MSYEKMQRFFISALPLQYKIKNLNEFIHAMTLLRLKHHFEKLLSSFCRVPFRIIAAIFFFSSILQIHYPTQSANFEGYFSRSCELVSIFHAGSFSNWIPECLECLYIEACTLTCKTFGNVLFNCKTNTFYRMWHI